MTKIKDGDLWCKQGAYRQVIRVDGDTVHWRNLGGKDRVSKLKNFAAWVHGAEKIDFGTSDLSSYVLKGLGAKWPDTWFYAGGVEILACELNGRYYLGVEDESGFYGDYSLVSKEFYDAFVKEFTPKEGRK